MVKHRGLQHRRPESADYSQADLLRQEKLRVWNRHCHSQLTSLCFAPPTPECRSRSPPVSFLPKITHGTRLVPRISPFRVVASIAAAMLLGWVVDVRAQLADTFDDCPLTVRLEKRRSSPGLQNAIARSGSSSPRAATVLKARFGSNHCPTIAEAPCSERRSRLNLRRGFSTVFADMDRLAW